jgi:preprotein translocase SecE subunit
MANIASTPQGSGEPRKSAGTLPTPTFRRGLKGFMNEVLREMKKVTWPTKAETNRLTGVVLLTCGAMVALLSFTGYFFETLISLITKGH